MPSFPPCVSRLPLLLSISFITAEQNAPQTRRPRQHRGGKTLASPNSRTNRASRCRIIFMGRRMLLACRRGEQQATRDLKRKSYTSLCLSISVDRGMPDPTKPFLLLQKFCTDLKENLYVNYPRTKSFPPFPQLSSPLFRKQLRRRRRRRPVDSQASLWPPACGKWVHTRAAKPNDTDGDYGRTRGDANYTA